MSVLKDDGVLCCRAALMRLSSGSAGALHDADDDNDSVKDTRKRQHGRRRLCGFCRWVMVLGCCRASLSFSLG